MMIYGPGAQVQVLVALDTPSRTSTGSLTRMDSDGKTEPGLPRASISDIETGINSSPTRNYGTDR